MRELDAEVHGSGPLLGKRVLITRPREQAAALADLLRASGATPIELPAIAITPLADYDALDAALARLSSYDWTIFTSVNGVTFFFDRLDQTGRDRSALARTRLCAIGPATAKALSRRGLSVDYVPEEYIAEAIVEGLKARGVEASRILLPRAREAREVIVAELSRAGATVDEVPVYQTLPAADQAAKARALFSKERVDIVTFTSSSTVSNLIALLEDDVAAINATTIACIGPVTADTAREKGLRVDVVAADHTMPGLVRAILEYLEE